MGIFTQVICANESSIESEFWEKHKDFISKNRNGHGCWIWKPKMVQNILRTLPDGAILFYCDAGCTLFKEGLAKFRRYIELTLRSKHDNLSFQMNFPEYQFTRRSILDTFQFPDVESGQLVGGIFFLKKSEFSSMLVDMWLENAEKYDLIGDLSRDSGEAADELPGFIANRNDQSIFSVIRKKYGTTAIRDETYFGPHYENFKQFPIHATRLKY